VQQLSYQQNKTEGGEIIPQWFDDCRRTVEDFAKFAGSNRIVLDLGPSDFERYRQKLLRKGLSGKGQVSVAPHIDWPQENPRRFAYISSSSVPRKLQKALTPRLCNRSRFLWDKGGGR
jgi:hypothetical protein